MIKVLIKPIISRLPKLIEDSGITEFYVKSVEDKFIIIYRTAEGANNITVKKENLADLLLKLIDGVDATKFMENEIN